MQCSILLVDDEKTMVKYLSRSLAKKGFDVAVAYSGEEALQHFRDADFDVVLLDVLMPGMDGIETLRAMKRIRPQTEVVLLTGHAAAVVGIDGMKAGAFNYIQKPFTPQELITEIRRACEKRRIMRKEGSGDGSKWADD